MVKKIKTRLDEQETVIVIDPLTKRASIFSCIPSTVNKMYELLDHPDAYTERDDKYGLTISVPQGWIKIKPPMKKNITEEQRAALIAQLAKARERKNDVAV